MNYGTVELITLHGSADIFQLLTQVTVVLKVGALMGYPGLQYPEPKAGDRSFL